MVKSKIFYKKDPKDYQTSYLNNNHQVSLIIVGLFDTEKVFWEYYVISTIGKTELKITEDLKSMPYSSCDANPTNVKKYGKQFKSIEEGKEFIDEFIIKWETGSNDSKRELRDKKIEELTK